jgi:7,8-dihydropterin-6-yl-methyl-4-(beta-D-ribofuranosyl)aminobenzene 5'-phosphate synthase
MDPLTALDSLTIDVLIDNQSDSYSSKPAFVSPEFNNVVAAGAAEISGLTLCCAQLGLALMLTAEAESKRHKLLFDAGPEGAILLRNCRNLGVTLNDTEAVALSHGHWDHMGAVTEALDAITGGGRRVPCHVNPGMFTERGVRLSNGAVVPFIKVASPDELSSHGAEVVNRNEARTLLDGFYYLSGEIPRVTTFEKGRVDHLCRDGSNLPWRPDPLLMDERYLAAHLSGKGLIVFSSCSHAGVINVLINARQTFPEIPLYGVFGGLHLVGTLEAIIPQTIEHLKQFNLSRIIPAHCTGFRAHHALLSAFGESLVVPSAVGSRYRL